MKIRTFLADDEDNARNLVRTFLQTYPQIEIVGEASDGLSCVKMVNDLKPDLLFLDIQMPRLTGFEVLELLVHKPMVVFATAYDQFAVKAFEASALDYLLKPFGRERFAASMQKVMNQLNDNEKPIAQTSVVEKIAQNLEEPLHRIVLKKGADIVVLAIDDVLYLEADGDYVHIHTAEGRFLKEATLNSFEKRLNASQFVRIHRSRIANINYIKKVEQMEKDSFIVVLKGNVQIRASQSGYRLLRSILNF